MQKANVVQQSKFLAIPIDEGGEATRIVRRGLFYGVFLVAGMFAWATLAPISGAVVADGIVKIDTDTKTIQHLDGGMVKEIYVKEGATVKRNQPLLSLENTDVSSKVNILNDKYNAAKAKEARFEAQRSKKSNIVFPIILLKSKDPKIKQLRDNETELFHSKLKSYKDKVANFEYEITQIEAQIKNMTDEMGSINNSMGFIEKDLRAQQTLAEQGYISKNQIWERQRILSEKKERSNAHLAQIASARVNITNIHAQISGLENDYKQEADDQLKETRQELAEIAEMQRPLKSQHSRATLVAPLEGQVINLKVNTVGGVIAPGQVLMEIVPKLNNLIVEVKIKTTDIDSVQVGQTADIQLSAYNRRKTPLLNGRVVYLSGDVILDPVKPGEYYYLSHIVADKKSLVSLPDNVKLFPGMPVSTFIKTRDRTFIDFMLEPIVDNMRRTFRED